MGVVIGLLLALPLLAGGSMWLLQKRRAACLAVGLALSLGHLMLAAVLFGRGALVESALAMEGFVLAFRADGQSCLFLLLGAVMLPLLLCFTWGFCRDKRWGGQYLFYLGLSAAMLDGALLADHLGLMLFFWEGLLGTLFGMLLLGNHAQPRAAVKALTLSGIADLLLMLGIAATVGAAGTARMSQIARLPISGMGALGCACLLAGALGKAGAMPFHSWIPQAAQDAPTPFLAAFPGSLEKLAGIYLIVRVVTELYDFQPGSPMSTALACVGAVTLFGGVGMALVQKDMKRLLAYHAISQVGYMVLGIGTGLAVGIAGGVFHMVNNVLYKAGLFMIAGAVEAQAGTSDLHKLGGLGRRMPVTAVCLILFALSIAGFPGTNGFFSKELIFDAALETNIWLYAAALAGAFMTAASFLKLTRAAFFGRFAAPRDNVGEAPVSMLLPAILLAAGCLVCGLWNALPLDGFIAPAFGITESFSGWPHSWTLVLISCGVLLLAVLDHIYGSKKTGSALEAVDHIHYAPGLKQIYAAADRGALDPFCWLSGAMGGLAWLCRRVEDGVSWIYDKGVPSAVRGVGAALSRFDNGRLSRYLVLAVCGMLLLGAVFVLMYI